MEKKKQDEYGPPTILHLPHATVRVFRPILTDEERERRMDSFKKACGRFMAAVEEERRKKKEEGHEEEH